MRLTPIWFGAPQRPLFGCVQVPDGAKTGIVLCLPLGEETSPGHRAYRVLTEMLARQNVAVLRFDYTGTGDSAGSLEDVPSVDQWIGDARAAVRVLREAGCTAIGIVGLRFGALVARHAAAEARADGLVLWDPCETGRRFLREQQAIGLASGVVSLNRGNGASELPGLRVPQPLFDSISSLRLDGRDPRLPGEVLVIVRPGRRVACVEEPPPETNVRWEVSDDQDRLFDVDPGMPFLPHRVIDLIKAWCVSLGDVAGPPLARSEGPASSWTGPVSFEAEPGRAVVERPVRIGDGGLFGIVTEPGTGGAVGPAVVLPNTGVDRHTGPARGWVDVARRWGARGASVLRFDIHGVGDSPVSTPGAQELAFPPEAVDDVAEAARFLAPADAAGVLLVGLCSGAYHAAEAATVLGSRAVWLVNPAVPQSAALRAQHEATGTGLTEPVRRATRRSTGLALRLSSDERAVALAHRLVPRAGWWALDKLGVYAYTARSYVPLVAAGTDVHLLCGRPEAERLLNPGASLLRRLVRGGRFHFEVVPEVDHTLRSVVSRREFSDRLDAYLAHLMGSSAPLDAQGGP